MASTDCGTDLIEFPSFNQLADCRYGKMLFNRNDRYIGKSLSLYGEYSQAEIELFRQILKPGSLVVEVGANIGTHTLFFCALGRPGGGGRGLRAAADCFPDPLCQHGAQ